MGIQALNHNDFLNPRARQLQRMLARSLEEADCGAPHRKLAPSSQNSRFDPAERASDNPTIWSRSIAHYATQRFVRNPWAAARMGWHARLSNASMGRRTSDVDGPTQRECSSVLSAATSFNSLFAR